MLLFAAAPLRWRRTPTPVATPEPVREPPLARPAVFIDKDGTLIDDMPANVDAARARLRPGVAQALAALAARGFALLVVTNQSGLARGYYTRAEFARFQAALERQVEAAAGVRLLDFLVCPHAPAPDGSPSCLCRKPAPGLLQRAARRHGIDLAQSWMVGDSLDDIEAGRRAGCRTALLGRLAEPVERMLRQPEVQCDGWGDVLQHVHATTGATPQPG